ncbi:MAG: hypothetical protein ACI8VC_000397 [Candidatus Endobugula sp.]|jgi:hypothetical protein
MIAHIGCPASRRYSGLKDSEIEMTWQVIKITRTFAVQYHEKKRPLY